MNIDSSVLIGRKCAELADQLGRVLLRAQPASTEASEALNHVADLTCCGLNALFAASKAETVEDFAQSYDRAVWHCDDAARWVRQRECGSNAVVNSESAV